jgi:hypothetical protein
MNNPQEIASPVDNMAFVPEFSTGFQITGNV